MPKIVRLVIATLRAMAATLRRLARRAAGVPPELDYTEIEEVAAEALAAEQPVDTLGARLHAWISARLHGAALPDLSRDPEAVVHWLESLSTAELASAVMQAPAALERHVGGRQRIDGLPQVVPLETYWARREAALLEAEQADMCSWILEDLIDDNDTVDAKRTARYG